MTNPGPNDPPIWAMFDGSGLQMRYLLDGRTADLAERDAFAALNANAGATDVYLAQVQFADPQIIDSWYEVGDRVYAPAEGETVTPPQP